MVDSIQDAKFKMRQTKVMTAAHERSREGEGEREREKDR